MKNRWQQSNGRDGSTLNAPTNDRFELKVVNGQDGSTITVYMTLLAALVVAVRAEVGFNVFDVNDMRKELLCPKGCYVLEPKGADKLLVFNTQTKLLIKPIPEAAKFSIELGVNEATASEPIQGVTIPERALEWFMMIHHSASWNSIDIFDELREDGRRTERTLSMSCSFLELLGIPEPVTLNRIMVDPKEYFGAKQLEQLSHQEDRALVHLQQNMKNTFFTENGWGKKKKQVSDEAMEKEEHLALLIPSQFLQQGLATENNETMPFLSTQAFANFSAREEGLEGQKMFEKASIFVNESGDSAHVLESSPCQQELDRPLGGGAIGRHSHCPFQDYFNDSHYQQYEAC